MKALIEADHVEAIKKTKEMFVQLKTNQSSISSNLRNLVFSVGVMTGSEEDWTWCHDLYTTTNVPSDRALLLHALGDTTDIFILQK